jgi:hypothetical protein
METELTISIGGLPPLSARGCEQELTPIIQGEFHRTINGDLIYLGDNTHTKYKSTVTCNDKTAIATDGLHRGSEIKLGCIQRLWQKIETDQPDVMLDKLAMLDSIYALDSDNNPIGIIEAIDHQLIKLETPHKGGFICYRPLLNMRVIQYHLKTNEWGIKVGWQIECEEI